jgi:hypothetical protein
MWGVRISAILILWITFGLYSDAERFMSGTSLTLFAVELFVLILNIISLSMSFIALMRNPKFVFEFFGDVLTDKESINRVFLDAVKQLKDDNERLKEEVDLLSESCSNLGAENRRLIDFVADRGLIDEIVDPKLVERRNEQ